MISPESGFGFFITKKLDAVFFKPKTKDHIIGCLPLFLGNSLG